jgi:hypothetical protein
MGDVGVVSLIAGGLAVFLFVQGLMIWVAG